MAPPDDDTTLDTARMRRALALARRALGDTSPNPMVGAVLVRDGRVIGEGWHRGAGQPHAEVEALADAGRRGESADGATLYVTLEPCCTHGRTPPCTDAIRRAGIRRVVVAATDPNPAHAGRGLDLLRAHGIRVDVGLLARQATALNAGFNHWIVHRTPWVTVKAALSLDGKIATAGGESKWITGPESSAWGQRLRREHDAILVGRGTMVADNPALTIRDPRGRRPERSPVRVILDTSARTPTDARVVSDAFAARTRVVVGPDAPARRIRALAKRVTVWQAPVKDGRVDPAWVLGKLGGEGITSLLVEGGGEIQAAFLLGGHAHRVAFFYAPTVLGGHDAPRAVAGDGVAGLSASPVLTHTRWRRLGPDLLLTADVGAPIPTED